MQTVGRLCRSSIRPLFLPATYVAQRGAPPPPQTTIKRVYDFIGAVLTTLILNYMAAPFMLLTWQDSIVGWSRLGWYGHIAVGGALAFFYLGGTKFLKRTQAARAKKAGVAVNGKASANGSGMSTPSTLDEAPTLPPLDDIAKEVEKAAFAKNL